MANKKLFGAFVAVVGGLALAACSSGGSCGSCNKGPAVYKKPCCAQSQGGGTYAPAPQAMPAPQAKPAGQMACGTGKCG
jgi:hypothetical protein